MCFAPFISLVREVGCQLHDRNTVEVGRRGQERGGSDLPGPLSDIGIVGMSWS